MSMDANELARLRDDALAILDPVNGYRPWDQDDRLGSGPWRGPALRAWEDAHGHDARLKCYAEFGCRLLEVECAENTLALLTEVERLADTDKAQGATIRGLEDENTELNNELGTAVQVLKLERDAALTDVERLRVEGEDIFAELKEITRERDSAIVEREALRARLAAVGELAEKWLSRIPHQSGGFYPEASAYDDGRDTSTDACADDLLTALAEGGA